MEHSSQEPSAGHIIFHDLFKCEINFWLMYADQMEKGQNYDVLKKCVSISILDFVLFKEEDAFYSSFQDLILSNSSAR